MVMRNLMMVWCCLMAVCSGAADIKYPVSAIPERLLKGANVVKRSEVIEFEISKLDEISYKRKVVLTILNERGSNYAGMVVGYDKLRKVTSFEGALYDAGGNLLKKAKNKDIQDFSAVDDISLFDDNRIKVLDFNYHSYPYTVEYEIELKMNNSYSFIDWIPQNQENLSVENSSYSITAPAEYTVRYKAFNYKEEPVTATEKNRKRMTWKVSGLPAVRKLFASPTWNELTTAVFFSPSEFEMEGYKGNASNWQELGKFALALNAGRDKLPDDIAQKVKDLTATAASEKEKVKLLYSFLQQNTRYISIQLGIGGLQPFEASFVAKKGYGDCKALSNYMYSLLKAAGIKSYYTLVHAGRDMDDKYLLEDFPSDKFNHIILCVPFTKDTMWLECTSQTEAPGYMGSFTGNRKALLVTEDGGKLVSTPRYGLNENRVTRAIKAKVKDDGTLKMTVEANYKGEQQDELSSVISQLSKDKVKKYLQEELELATYEVNDFAYTEKKSQLPELAEKLEVTVSNYATITGKRLFVTPNILSRGGMKLDEEERKVDYVFDYEFRNEDQVEIEIPEGYVIEAAPKDVTIKNKFGAYSSSAKLEGNKIIYNRVREQYAGRFPAADQAQLIKFYDEIFKADRSRLVLVKKAE